MNRSKLLLAVLTVLATTTPVLAIPTQAEIPVVEWIRQLGPAIGRGVSIDVSGNIYITGITGNDLDGNTHMGSTDMFLTKYDTDGTKLWTRQLGTPIRDLGYAVSVDTHGNAYVTGYTQGDLDGNTHAGIFGWDSFLTKYDTDGNKLWTRQQGTAEEDTGNGVSVDADGNAYITGWTEGDLDGNTNAGRTDVYLTKYDTDGNKLWTQQLGTSGSDFCYGMSLDTNGNAYVTGRTWGSLDGNTNAGYGDMFLVKYDTGGTKRWTRQLGTNKGDAGIGVSLDADGNAYVTGITESGLDGNTHAGDEDMFLTKYDTNGIKLWTQQLGTAGGDYGRGVSVDVGGNVYVTGWTEGGLDGNTNAGRDDIFLTKYDKDGNKIWTEQFGTDSDDCGWGLSIDDSGNVYITGETHGGLGDNPIADGSDMFLIKISTIPEPSSLGMLLTLGGLLLLRKRQR